MINSLINGFLNLVFDVLNWFVSLLTMPFYNFLVNLFPNLETYNNTCSAFLNDYVFKGLAFARELFLNFTGFPRDLYYILVFYLVGIFALCMSLTVVNFITNIFRYWKRGL